MNQTKIGRILERNRKTTKYDKDKYDKIRQKYDNNKTNSNYRKKCDKNTPNKHRKLRQPIRKS